MAHLLVRVGASDAALMARMLGTDGGSPAARRPDRLVVDAHVPARTSELAVTARTAGVPLLVDPQTFYLQDLQHPADAWANLAYAAPAALTPADLMRTATQDRLVDLVIEHQVVAGATAVIAPYVHIERVNNGWPEVQARLWRRTRKRLDRHGISLPVIGLIALGWRCLHPIQGIPAMASMWDALRDLAPNEVALAASKVHLGTTATDRLAELLAFVHNLAAEYPVIMWQQGLLGEACIVAGASGYETGIGWREMCALNQSMAAHRASPSGHPGARPVYVEALGRSIPKRSLERLHGHSQLWARLLCTDPACCAPGGADMLGDARAHAVISRSRNLARIDQAHRTQWKWNDLSARTAQGLVIGNRVNAMVDTTSGLNRVDLTALTAINTIASSRRQRQPIRRIA